MTFNRDLVLAEVHEDKNKVRPYNTQRNEVLSMNNFAAFLKKKYDETPLSICKKLASETDVKVPCGVLQAWVSWSLAKKHSPATIRTRFWYIKDYFYDKGVELTNQQIKKNINMPKIQKEELYALSKEELRKIVDVASVKRKSLYLTQSSSGCRIGELLQLRKSDIDTDSERWMIKLRSETTKTQTARTTFMSKESMKYTKPLLQSINDNDLVWGSHKNAYFAEATEQKALRTCLAKVGLDMKYEKNGYRKITSHSFRAYFATRAVRVHGENYMNKMIGHAGYLMEYDRYDLEKKLEMYLKLEPELLVYENYNEDITDLREDNKKLRGEFNDMKKGLQSFQTILDITTKSVALENPFNQSMKKQLLKTFGKDKLREDIEKSIKEAQSLGLTEEMFSKILKKHTKEKN